MIRNDTNHTRNTLKETNHDIEIIKNDVCGVRADVDEVKDTVAAMKAQMKDFEKQLAKQKEENAELRAEIKRVDGKVDKNTDNACRDTITVHGIPRTRGSGKDGRETWPDTKRVLAKFLAEKCGSGTTKGWIAKITRAHRGLRKESNVMHVLLESWTYKEEIMDLFKKAKGNIHGAFVLEKFSGPTTDRRQLCIAERDEIRKASPLAKMWIKYPATLMCQLPGEEGYKEVAIY